jgi:hypothetical protein
MAEPFSPMRANRAARCAFDPQAGAILRSRARVPQWELAQRAAPIDWRRASGNAPDPDGAAGWPEAVGIAFSQVYHSGLRHGCDTRVA